MQWFILQFFSFLTAFSIGIVSACFSIQTEQVRVPAEPLSAIKKAGFSPLIDPDRIPEEITPLTEPKPKKKFVCKDAALSFVLDKLRHNKELGDDYIDGSILAAGVENCNELFQKTRKVDLNGDGRNELVISAQGTEKWIFFCGATGNCSTWLLAKSGKSFKVILDAGSVEELKVAKGTSKNFKNLRTQYSGGMMDKTMVDYAYRDGKYIPVKCFEEVTDINGHTEILTKAMSSCL